MQPSKMRQHLESKHPYMKNEPAEFFQRKLASSKTQQEVMFQTNNVNKKSLHASFLASLRIAKARKLDTIGETMIAPCVIDMMTIMKGPDAANKLKNISHSNETISRGIHEMTADIREQLFNRVCESELFAIQLDESTDVSGAAQLLPFCAIRL